MLHPICKNVYFPLKGMNTHSSEMALSKLILFPFYKRSTLKGKKWEPL